MKKLFTAMTLLMSTLTVSAQGNQKILEDDDYLYDEPVRATHPDFSYDNQVQLFARSGDYSNGNRVFTFFDDNFDIMWEWTIPSFPYTYYDQTLTSAITGYQVKPRNEEDYIDRIYDSSTGKTSFYDYDSNEYIVVEGAMTVEQARSYIKSSLGVTTIRKEETTDEGTFFYVEYLGENGSITRSSVMSKISLVGEYPTRWFWLTTDGSLNMVRRYYTVKADVGEFVEGEKVYHTGSFNMIDLSFSDYDAPYEQEARVNITQTLFNDDAKFEFIRPLVTDGLSDVYQGTSYEFTDGMEIEVPYIIKKYGGKISGFQVVNEDGAVLQTINFDGNFVMSYSKDDNGDLLRIHGKLYLAFYGRVIDESNNTCRYATLVYQLDRQGNQIKKVAEHVGGVCVYPRVADRTGQITVELNEDGNGISEIRVVNANGQTEVRVPVKAGQKRVTIPANQLSRGMNVVNAVGGRSRSAHKVMIK